MFFSKFMTRRKLSSIETCIALLKVIGRFAEFFYNQVWLNRLNWRALRRRRRC